MKRKTMCILIPMLLLIACGKDAPQPVGLDQGLGAHRARGGWSEWSEPVNLGPVVNSAFTDIAAKLSPNGLSLYFVSTRPGGVGTGNDIWVSRRASRHSPWEAPVNLSMINTAQDDGGPSLSPDGLMLFFNSQRPGGQGAADIWVSRRSNPHDDMGWGPAVNLGPLVNTTGGERGPQFVLHGENGEPTLYFNTGAINLQGADLYAVPMSRDGEPLGPPVLVPNVNAPGANDAGQHVSGNGKVIWFWSGRIGGFGDADLWMSSRKSTHDAWSEPVNLGSPPNSESSEERPFVTRDGHTLLFDSFRAEGSFGGQDIWMSTRVTGEPEDDDDRDEGLRFSEWSAPVNLGPIVNSAVGDLEMSLSKNGLSLYIASNRPGGTGNFDLYVSQRAKVDDAWGPPQNLGAAINTDVREQAPFLSPDGHRLYFFSDRPGGFGGTDLYVSRRHDTHDDFSWGPPENLGSGVNGASNDVTPVYFEDEASGTVTLYFGSNRSGGSDIYSSTLQADGTFGLAAPVGELNSTGRDAPVAVRRDGLEMLIASDRTGTLGLFDLWVTTRATTSDPWSTPVNLGPVVNSAADDSRGSLSRDGTTLYMESDRLGGLGGHDLWVTTRSRLKGKH